MSLEAIQRTQSVYQGWRARGKGEWVWVGVEGVAEGVEDEEGGGICRGGGKGKK